MKSLLLLAHILLLVAGSAGRTLQVDEVGEDGAIESSAVINNSSTSGTSSTDAPPVLPCTVCSGGGSMSRADKDVVGQYGTFWPPELYDIFLSQDVSTCSEADALYSAAFTADDPICQPVRFALAGVCGCPALPQHCELCPGEELPYPDFFITEGMWAEYAVQDVMAPTSCSDFQIVLNQIPASNDSCSTLQNFNFFCSCNGGRAGALLGTGKSAERKEKALLWIPRVMGVLSIIASLSIIQHILRHRSPSNMGTSRRSVMGATGQNNASSIGGITVQRELLLALSFFDILSSTAWAFASYPLPSESAIYGAHGNSATCTAQGFFVQLGQTGAFYNMTLSFLYLMTIRYGWRDHELRRVSKYFHLASIAGLGMAFGGIPFYGNTVWGCYIQAPPFADSITPLVMFSIIPISIVTIIATVNMVLVYLHVRQHDASNSRWRFSNTDGRSANMGSAVFWQSTVYLAGFYFVWPVFMIYNLSYGQLSYPIYVLAVLFTPTQGLWNALAYFRPIIIIERQRRRRDRSSLTESADRRFGSSMMRLWKGKKPSHPESAGVEKNTGTGSSMEQPPGTYTLSTEHVMKEQDSGDLRMQEDLETPQDQPMEDADSEHHEMAEEQGDIQQ